MYYLSRFVRIYQASPTATRSHSVQFCDPNHAHSYILYIPWQMHTYQWWIQIQRHWIVFFPLDGIALHQ